MLHFLPFSFEFYMKNNRTIDDSESTALGWKFIAIVAVLTTIFFTFLYLAMSSEPDYMPSHKQKLENQQKNVSVSHSIKQTSSK